MAFNRTVEQATSDAPTPTDLNLPGIATTRTQWWIGLLLVLISTAAMIAITWRHCPDPIEDYGREVYVPWRLSQGAVLYRDIHYFNGPLAPYLNAILFKLFGARIDTLKSFNALLIAGLALLIWQGIRTSAGMLAAVTAAVVFAVLFACGQSGGATFNFLTPYSHDLTYGVALAIGSILCIRRGLLRSAAGKPGITWWIPAGFLLGLVFLTKPEVFLASLLATASAGIAFAGRRRAMWKPATAVFLSMLAPIILAIVLLALFMPLGQAAAGVAGGWKWIGNSDLVGMPYYRWVMGIDQPLMSLALALGWLAGWIAVAAAGIALDWLTIRMHWRARLVAGIAAITLAACGIIFWQYLPWRGALRPVALLLIILLIWQIRELVRCKSEPAAIAVWQISVGILAAALLLKTPLRVQPFHYGFALAPLATIYVLVAGVYGLPRLLRRCGMDGRVTRSLLLAAVTVMVFAYTRMGIEWMQLRKVPFAEDGNRFNVLASESLLNDVIRDLKNGTPANAMVTVLPEGSMINFLTRRISPTADVSFMPPEVIMFGEQRMLADLRANPPDYIVLLHRDTLFYGPRFFGQNYARSIAGWIAANYDVAGGKLYGRPPFNPQDQFGILVISRKATATTRAGR